MQHNSQKPKLCSKRFDTSVFITTFIYFVHIDYKYDNIFLTTTHFKHKTKVITHSTNIFLL